MCSVQCVVCSVQCIVCSVLDLLFTVAVFLLFSLVIPLFAFFIAQLYPVSCQFPSNIIGVGRHFGMFKSSLNISTVSTREQQITSRSTFLLGSSWSCLTFLVFFEDSEHFYHHGINSKHTLIVDGSHIVICSFDRDDTVNR